MGAHDPSTLSAPATATAGDSNDSAGSGSNGGSTRNAISDSEPPSVGYNCYEGPKLCSGPVTTTRDLDTTEDNTGDKAPSIRGCVSCVSELCQAGGTTGRPQPEYNECFTACESYLSPTSGSLPSRHSLTSNIRPCAQPHCPCNPSNGEEKSVDVQTQDKDCKTECTAFSDDEAGSSGQKQGSEAPFRSGISCRRIDKAHTASPSSWGTFPAPFFLGQLRQFGRRLPTSHTGRVSPAHSVHFYPHDLSHQFAHSTGGTPNRQAIAIAVVAATLAAAGIVTAGGISCQGILLDKNGIEDGAVNCSSEAHGRSYPSDCVGAPLDQGGRSALPHPRTGNFRTERSVSDNRRLTGQPNEQAQQETSTTEETQTRPGPSFDMSTELLHNQHLSATDGPGSKASCNNSRNNSRKRAHCAVESFPGISDDSVSDDSRQERGGQNEDDDDALQNRTWKRRSLHQTSGRLIDYSSLTSGVASSSSMSGSVLEVPFGRGRNPVHFPPSIRLRAPLPTPIVESFMNVGQSKTSDSTFPDQSSVSIPPSVLNSPRAPPDVSVSTTIPVPLSFTQATNEPRAMSQPSVSVQQDTQDGAPTTIVTPGHGSGFAKSSNVTMDRRGTFIGPPNSVGLHPGKKHHIPRVETPAYNPTHPNERASHHVMPLTTKASQQPSAVGDGGHRRIRSRSGSRVRSRQLDSGSMPEAELLANLKCLMKEFRLTRSAARRLSAKLKDLRRLGRPAPKKVKDTMTQLICLMLVLTDDLSTMIKPMTAVLMKEIRERRSALMRHVEEYNGLPPNSFWSRRWFSYVMDDKADRLPKPLYVSGEFWKAMRDWRQQLEFRFAIVNTATGILQKYIPLLLRLRQHMLTGG